MGLFKPKQWYHKERKGDHFLGGRAHSFTLVQSPTRAALGLKSTEVTLEEDGHRAVVTTRRVGLRGLPHELRVDITRTGNDYENVSAATVRINTPKYKGEVVDGYASRGKRDAAVKAIRSILKRSRVFDNEGTILPGSGNSHENLAFFRALSILTHHARVI